MVKSSKSEYKKGHARKDPPAAAAITDNGGSGQRVNLGALLSQEKDPSVDFDLWIVGRTPIICHSWSEKAKKEILDKQVGRVKAAKEKRDPEEDFMNSLYEMGRDPKTDKPVFGFPITAVKKAIFSCAHKDRGVPKVAVQAGLWLDAEIVRVRPALSKAICDMPLVRLWAGAPEMREDMVRIGSGLRKVANLAYRAQFFPWAIRITGNVHPDLVAPHQLGFLIKQAGRSQGLGDWRNERGGWAGGFSIAGIDEQRAWIKFALGKGPLPQPKVRSGPPPIQDLELPGEAAE